MKKMVKLAIIILIFLLVIIGGIYYFTQRNSEEGININFGNSKNTGEEIGKVTDVNSFDDVKLNPFKK